MTYHITVNDKDGNDLFTYTEASEGDALRLLAHIIHTLQDDWQVVISRSE